MFISRISFRAVLLAILVPLTAPHISYASDPAQDAKESLDGAISCITTTIRNNGYKSDAEMKDDNAIAKYCKPEFINFFTMCKEYENANPDLGDVCSFMYAMEMLKVSQRFGWKKDN